MCQTRILTSLKTNKVSRYSMTLCRSLAWSIEVPVARISGHRRNLELASLIAISYTASLPKRSWIKTNWGTIIWAGLAPSSKSCKDRVIKKLKTYRNRYLLTLKSLGTSIMQRHQSNFLRRLINSSSLSPVRIDSRWVRHVTLRSQWRPCYSSP